MQGVGWMGFRRATYSTRAYGRQEGSGAHLSSPRSHLAFLLVALKEIVDGFALRLPIRRPLLSPPLLLKVQALRAKRRVSLTVAKGEARVRCGPFQQEQDGHQ